MDTPAAHDRAPRRRVVIRAVPQRRRSHPSVFAGARGPQHRRPPALRLPALSWQVGLAVLSAAIALTAAAALTYHLVDHQGSTAARNPAPSAASLASGRLLAQWARANLPSGTPIVTDGGTASLLQARGFTSATADARTCRADRFVFLTPSLAQRAQQDPALAACVNSSIAVAAAGGGAGASELRVITSDRLATARARRQDLANRRQGGAALAANPAVSMSAQVRSELRAGRLDLRAEAVLAELSRHVPVRIDVIRDERVEAQAGMPARTVVIQLPDPTQLQPLLANVAAAYRPTVIRVRPNATTLTWAFRAEPPPVLQ
jgi:hypothetical protein